MRRSMWPCLSHRQRTGEPDHYVIGKRDLAVRAIRVARKAFMFTRDEQGRNVRVDECLAITGER